MDGYPTLYTFHKKWGKRSEATCAVQNLAQGKKLLGWATPKLPEGLRGGWLPGSFPNPPSFPFLDVWVFQSLGTTCSCWDPFNVGEQLWGLYPVLNPRGPHQAIGMFCQSLMGHVGHYRSLALPFPTDINTHWGNFWVCNLTSEVLIHQVNTGQRNIAALIDNQQKGEGLERKPLIAASNNIFLRNYWDLIGGKNQQFTGSYGNFHEYEKEKWIKQKNRFAGRFGINKI